MNRCLASESGTGELAAAIRDYLIYVHVELRAASRHPDMQGKNVLMPAGENLVTDLHDQSVPMIVEPSAGLVRVGSGFLQHCVRGNHFPRHQVLADTEVLQRALRLS